MTSSYCFDIAFQAHFSKQILFVVVVFLIMLSALADKFELNCAHTEQRIAVPKCIINMNNQSLMKHQPVRMTVNYGSRERDTVARGIYERYSTCGKAI